MRVEDFAARFIQKSGKPISSGGVYAMAKRKRIPPKLVEKLNKILNLNNEFWESPLEEPPIPGITPSNSLIDSLAEMSKEMDSIKILLETKDKYINALEDQVQMLKEERERYMKRQKSLH
jgi:hypothetical protein